MADIDSFEKDYNDIKNYLIKLTNSNSNTKFHELRRKAKNNPVIKRYDDELDNINKLRNVIVHGKSKKIPRIAEPTENGVMLINEIASSLLNPPKIIPLFQKKLYILQPNAPISDALKIMFEKSFSQIPLYNNDNFVGLLTTNTIVRWLGACVQDSLYNLKNTIINSIFEKYTEDKNNYSFFKGSNSIYKVIEEFQKFESSGKKLDAILITENGSKKEKPLGIITVWDLVEINKRLN